MRFATAEPIGVLPRGPAGPAGITFQGVWSPNSTYSQRAVVRYQAALWYARRGSTGRPPGSDPTYWELFVPKGAKGEDGDTPTFEYRQTDDYLQIRRIGDVVWIDAIALADITGEVGPTPDSNGAATASTCRSARSAIRTGSMSCRFRRSLGRKASRVIPARRS
jgi:hypothetical protein